MDAVGIAFISIPLTSPRRNLHISLDPLSPFIYLQNTGIEKQAPSSTFLVSTRDFLMTDVFASLAEGSAVPLYWKHLLPKDARSDGTVMLYDQDFQPLEDVPFLHWRTEEENAVFNNLTPRYDPETGSYQVYYISYLGADGVRRVELLNNVPAFALLEVEEYDQLTPRRRYYSLEDRGTHYLVTCLFDYKSHSPTPRELSYIVTGQAYGELLQPLNMDATLPWMPRIGKVDFYWMGRDNYLRRYYLSDFDYQSFSPYNPYRFVSQIPGAVLSPRLIKTPHGHLKVDPDESFHVECIVVKPDGTVRYALTTDSQKVLYVNPAGETTGIRYRTDGFASFSLREGFIQLSLDIDVSDQVFLTYNYAEQAYDYPWLNLNPRFNPDILEQEGVIYLVPSRIFTRLTNLYSDAGNEALANLGDLVEQAFGQGNLLSTFSEIEEYFWYTADILILDAAESSLDAEAIEAALTIGKLVLVNGSQYTVLKNALGITTDDLVLTSGNLSHTYSRYRLGLLVNASLAADGLADSYQGLSDSNKQSLLSLWRQLAGLTEDVIAKDPAPEQSLFHLLLDSQGIIIESNHPDLPLVGKTWDQFLSWFSTDIKNCNQFLVLGHLQVTTGGVQPYQIKTVDCRQRGGGYKVSDRFPLLAAAYPEVNWCLDQARVDGHPFAGAAAVLIELPYTILKEYGGFLSRKEVQSKVKKHLGAGVYPVIRYYGSRDPRILTCESTATTITLTWEDTGGPYTVYWGNSPDSFPYRQVVNNTSFTITDLNPGFFYTVLVTPVMDNSRMLSQEPLTVSLPSA